MEIPAVLERTFDAGAPIGAGKRVVAALGVPIFFGLVAIVVYVTGGTENAYLHLIYLPILAAAAAFGVVGGILAGLFAGLVVLGPAMPLDVLAGTPQPTLNWLFRAGMLLLFGIATGFTVGRLREQLDRIRGTTYRHPFSRLPTRAAFEAIVAEILRRRAKGNGRYGVITLHVNNVDQVFNILGPAFVDELPVVIAERLRLLFSKRWQIFHSHAGKLVMLVSEERVSAIDRAEQAVSRLDEPVTVAGVPVYVDVSAGVASVTYADEFPDAVLQRSNYAAGYAQRANVPVFAYEHAVQKLSRDRLDLLSELPRAIADDELRLVYQPQFSLRDGRMTGVEALLRWHHPRRGLIRPGHFMPMVEDTGLVNRLSLWVADAAVAQALAWRAAGMPVSVAINLSPRNLHSQKFVRRLVGLISDAGLEPGCLELELTETAIIQDTRALHSGLSLLKEAGATLALDDFGDGYTSIRHLTSLPLDRLKIDRSLVNRVCTHSGQARIVSAMLLMARDLGLETVAEGVEDEPTEAFLEEHGCDLVQGFLYSRPLSPDAITEQLSNPESATIHWPSVANR